MKYIEKLRNSGLRPTKQRLQICEILFDTEKTSLTETFKIDEKHRIQDAQVILDDLRQVYKQYLNKYKKDKEDTTRPSNIDWQISRWDEGRRGKRRHIKKQAHKGILWYILSAMLRFCLCFMFACVVVLLF